LIVAKVVGTVVCTRKDEKLTGAKLQVVQPVSLMDGSPDGKPIVAVDSVGAGQGEVVLVVSGSSARQTSRTQNTPVDATIMAIVDTIEVDGKVRFRKEA
jgi:microcompartment protein CcmK/EutM